MILAEFMGWRHVITSCWGGTTMGSMPFLKQLLKKISAKEGATTHLMPKSSRAQGACSGVSDGGGCGDSDGGGCGGGDGDDGDGFW